MAADAAFVLAVWALVAISAATVWIATAPSANSLPAKARVKVCCAFAAASATASLSVPNKLMAVCAAANDDVIAEPTFA